ncbi:hypothetical protein R1flu_010130 [Riccia fluitans]|uniref:Uncharacterized protein n=1 Tax=Riccia fluitans TaxID=41844 RepID=A0ABD1Z4Z9_9MARC
MAIGNDVETTRKDERRGSSRKEAASVAESTRGKQPGRSRTLKKNRKWQTTLTTRKEMLTTGEQGRNEEGRTGGS